MKNLIYTLLGLAGAVFAGGTAWTLTTDGGLAQTFYAEDIKLKQLQDEEREAVMADWEKVLDVLVETQEIDAKRAAEKAEREKADKINSPSPSNTGSGGTSVKPKQSQSSESKLFTRLKDGLDDAMEAIRDAGKVRDDERKVSAAVETSLSRVSDAQRDLLRDWKRLDESEQDKLREEVAALRARFSDQYIGGKSPFALFFNNNKDLHSKMLECGHRFNEIDELE